MTKVVFQTLRFAATLIACGATYCVAEDHRQVERFGFYEMTCQATGSYANPYAEVDAQAQLQLPDSSTRVIPLFWDGANRWTLRLSPDAEGTWSYRITSNDGGLDGATGEFLCVPSQRTGSIQKQRDFPLHFQRQNGTPFLFWGDTAWGLYLDNNDEKLDREAVFHYIDKRAAEGVSVVHSMLLSEAGWGNSGGMPFEDIAHEVINPAYWREVDVRLRHLNEKQIVGGLVLAWGDKGRGEPFAWRRFPNIAARQRYARYIAARYGAFEVYFVLAGEWHAEIRSRTSTEEEVRGEFISLGETLASADAHRRMIAIHPMTARGSTREFNKTNWMSFGDYQQNYEDVHLRVLQSRAQNQPVVNSEYGYFLRDFSGDGKVDKHNSFGADDMRFTTWDIVMAGGYPVTGYGTTYMGGYRDPGPFNPDDPRNDVWTLQYSVARQFLEKLDWCRLQPHDDLVSCSQSRTKDRVVEVSMSPTQKRRVRRPPVRTYWLLARPGNCYIAYMRGITDPITVALGERGSGLYNMSCFNPRTGQSQLVAAGRFLEQSATWTPPDQNDWVLQLACIEQLDRDEAELTTPLIPVGLRTFYGTGYHIYHLYDPSATLSQPVQAWDGSTPPSSDVLDLLRAAGSDIAPQPNTELGKRLEIREQSGTLRTPQAYGTGTEEWGGGGDCYHSYPREAGELGPTRPGRRCATTLAVL